MVRSAYSKGKTVLMPKIYLFFLAIGLAVSGTNTLAQDSASVTELAKQAQNPIANMFSVPFQWNWNFDVGPLEKDQHIVNFQPVLPFELNDDWNVITRTILPLISQPAFTPAQTRKNGIGDINFTAFFSPKEPTSSGWIWGVGPVVTMDTASSDNLGQGAWSLGGSAIVLKSSGPWVTGALINNVWSVSEDSGRDEVNQMLVQPFINYNFPDKPGRYLSFSPVMTANWEADSGQKWTVPLGLGIGQIVTLGKIPTNLQFAAYYNVARPDFAARWQIRAQLVLLFPR